MDADILVPGMFFFTVIVMGIGIPWIRARVRQMDRSNIGAPVDHQVHDRLAHIEQAIDAIAVEVERVAEGQRFVTRVLAERAPEPAALPRDIPRS